MQNYFKNFFFPLNHCYALLMWTYLFYFNLLSIAMIDFTRCWKILVSDPLELYTVILEILHNNYLIQFGVFLFQ